MSAILRKALANRNILAGVFLAALVCAMYLPNLGSYAFWDPWEPHYAQVAKEMADHRTWMDPTYRGQTHWWSKPILPLWSLRLSFAMFGVDGPDSPILHFAGRFPIFIFALLGVLLTFRWVSRLFGRRAGIFSAIILASSPMYALLAHQVMFDMPFVSLCAASVGYYFLSRSPEGKPGDIVVFYVLAGLAFLSKWLLALFIPAGILLSFLIIRWDSGFFRRVGFKHWLVTGLVFVATGIYFFLSLSDPLFAAMLMVCVLAFLLVYWMGRDSVSQSGTASRFFWIGFGAFILIVAPWHVFMIVKHGWPFVREAVVYHHFDRAAGTIGKPEATFDVYVKQLAFALYPWITLLPVAFVKFLKWGAADLEGKGQKSLWVFLAAAVPYAAFSMFQTKFHHYIFPVVPFLAVMIGVYLDRAADMHDRAWMRLSVMLAFPVGAMLLADIMHEYKWFVHMFDYYYGWPLPAQLNPYPFFAAIGALWLLILAWLFFRTRVGVSVFVSMAVVAISMTVFLTAWILPRVTRTFTLEPLYRAYMRESGGKAPIAQYNGWLSRSASFYFDNRVEDLSKADQPNLDRAIHFLQRPGRTFMILGAGFGRDCRSLLADLRPKVKKRLGKSLYVVFDQHPFACLVSTERDPKGQKKLEQKIMTKLPDGVKRLQVDFDHKIMLVGYKLKPEEVKRGGKFTISYFFRCLSPVGDDWLVFIHGDGPQGGAHRVFGDHTPVEGLYPTSEWKPGEIIQDDYEMVVPANYPYDSFTLWMGFWKGPKRLPVSNKHQHDGANRVRTALVKIQ